MKGFVVRGPRGGVVGRGSAQAVAKALPKILGRFRKISVSPAVTASSGGSGSPITMYDSVSVLQLPGNAAAVAGYVNGAWPTYTTLLKTHRGAHVLSVDVRGNADADCLDVEAGDASPGDAPAWVRRQQGRGVRRPVVYSSVSEWPRVAAALRAAKVDLASVRIWTAHYTGKPHRCSSSVCGFELPRQADATQYTDRALGRNLDASLCAPDFFD